MSKHIVPNLNERRTVDSDGNVRLRIYKGDKIIFEWDERAMASYQEDPDWCRMVADIFNAGVMEGEKNDRMDRVSCRFYSTDHSDRDDSSEVVKDFFGTSLDHIRLCSDCNNRFWTTHESKCMVCRDTI